MMIGLFPNELKDRAKTIAIEIRGFLNEHGIQVFAEDEKADEIGAIPLSQIDPNKVDFLISLGGDGTILRLVHKHPHLSAPILGINLGSLGFMADIPVSDIYPSLQDLLDGSYTIQNRMMLEGTTTQNEKSFAVNEVVIHRGRVVSLVEMAIHVDGDYLNTFTADGMIISTATGSTAYSLSAGGPILAPNIESFVLTPICPHTISIRPIVLMPSKSIKVEYISHYAPLEIIFDGTTHFSMATGESLTITVSQKKFRLVSLLRHDYFTTLRTKLGWTGKLKG